MRPIRRGSLCLNEQLCWPSRQYLERCAESDLATALDHNLPWQAPTRTDHKTFSKRPLCVPMSELVPQILMEWRFLSRAARFRRAVRTVEREAEVNRIAGEIARMSDGDVES